MTIKIDASKIDVDFGENDELKDRVFLELLKKAYRGEIMCRTAEIRMEAIEPFAPYEPKISDEFRSYFMEKSNAGNPIPMYVYQRGGKFIMSDDHSSYFMYKELRSPNALCVVIGDISDRENIIDLSEPFRLPVPQS